MGVQLPGWWHYPEQCQLGHPWGPDLVRAEWQECDCPNARARTGRGHLVIRCGTEGCTETWMVPVHQDAGFLGHHRPGPR
jgi:hypothetical protein